MDTQLEGKLNELALEIQRSLDYYQGPAFEYLAPQPG